MEVFMAAQSQKDSEAELDERFVKLTLDIMEASMFCDTERHSNTLAIILLVRAMDILEARHGADAFMAVNAVLEDRRQKRMVLMTEDQMARFESCRKFLP
jgi:hypothetical protein